MASEQKEVPLLVAKPRADDVGSLNAAVPRYVLAALGLTLVIGTVIGLGGYGLANGLPYLTHTADEQTPQRRIDRQKAFEAMGEMALPLVTEDDLPKAIQAMALPSEAKVQFIADQQHASMPTGAPPGAPTAKALAAGPVSAVPMTQTQAGSTPAIQVTKPLDRMRLAWLTLWDTDDEDGDIVRIDSNGYSRVIYLTKVPVAYPVPIAGQGQISVVGLKDGEGGGITVGVMADNSPVALPIMSTGQTLALHVHVK